MGQPKMKYWKLHELHKNEVKNVHPICAYAQKCGNLQFEQLPKHNLRVFPSWGGGGGGGGGKFNSLGLGSHPFI